VLAGASKMGIAGLSWPGRRGYGCSVGDRMPATLDGFHGAILDFAATHNLASSTR
jgi:hypothetical protein